jgi:hypothetical protein|tara:strand:- start:608 stop:862 length:255 start_codon:yes stop_codon:yes gene_type:complete
MNKPAILKTLLEYFLDKGKILSIDEYKAAQDAPMRFMVAKRAFGSWARMSQMIEAKMRVDNTPMPAPAPAPKAKPASKKAEKEG